MVAGAYSEGSSFLHKTDPRVKLFCLVFTAVLFFLPLALFKYYIFIFFISALGFAAVGLRETFKPVKVILPLLILIIILTPPFNTEGRIYLLFLNRPVITSAGMYEAFHLAGRFTGITLVFYLFLRTTRIEDFILSLRFFGLSYRIALIMSLTLRSIPSIASMYENTRDAHKMRLTEKSASVSGWNLPARFKNIISVLTSVMIQAIKSIPVLAMALEARGVGRKSRPGKMKKMKSIKDIGIDIILSFSMILVMVYIISL